jgi:adenine deaminase
VLKNGAPVGAETFARPGRLPAIGYGSIKLDPVGEEDFSVAASGPTVPVIGLVPGSIITKHLRLALPYRQGFCAADPSQDVLKLAVFARHGVNRNVGRGFVKGFGLKAGALASSVGHDSHNVIVVGRSEAEMAAAVNRLIGLGGGFVAIAGQTVVAELPLPIAGLMSDRPFEEVAGRLRALRQAVRALGCPLAEPFLQLAFLPLPVIPHLKITDRGLVDVDRHTLIAA